MIPVLLKLGPITIYSFGVMMALGFFAASSVLTAEGKRRGLNRDFASSLAISAAIAGLVGARLNAVIENSSAYMRHPWSIIFSSSEFVWYGGLIGMLAASYLVSRYYRISFATTADMAG